MAFICAITTLCSLILYYLLITYSGWFGIITSQLRAMEYWSEDMRVQYGRPAPIAEEVLYLAVEQPNYESTLFPDEREHPALKHMCQQWPWNREVWAHVLDRLIQDGGAKVVALDFLFYNPSPNDDMLADRLERYKDNAIIAADVVRVSDVMGERDTLQWPLDKLTGGIAHSLDRVGIVTLKPEDQHTIRRALFYENSYSLLRDEQFLVPSEEDKRFFYRSLSALALEKAGLTEHLPDVFERPRIRFAGPPETVYKHHPIISIFIESMWQHNFKNGEAFKDKIVVIGPIGAWQHDYHPTPYPATMPGPEVHCHVMGAAIHNQFIYHSNDLTNFLIIIFLGGFACYLSIRIKLPLTRFFLICLIGLLYLAVTQIFYDTFDLYLLAILPVANLAGGGAICLVYQVVLEQLDKARVRSTLERYVSKNVVKEILDGSVEFESSLGGTRKPVTVLFSDIRGFTTMTEIEESEALVAQLNEYLTRMVHSVFEHRGTLDKFIGDAVMAVWGNARSEGAKADAISSVQAAMAMQDELADLNKKWIMAGRPAFNIGIGINHGEVIVGNMGSPERMEFTVIGDAVNLASRLEGLTKLYTLSLIIGQNVAELVKDEFVLQTVDYVQVKGKNKPVDTFTVINHISEGLEDQSKESLRVYEEAIVLYRKGNFEEAKEKFRQASDTWYANLMAEFYVRRCEELIENPPTEEWTGVYVAKSK